MWLWLCVQREGLKKDSVHCVLVHVRPQAEEDPSTQHEDGGSPAEPIAPVKLVIGLKNCSINELDRVEDESAGLQNHWNQERDKHEILQEKELVFVSELCFYFTKYTAIP